MGMRYRICNEMALAVDAVGRARDNLPADAPQLDVSTYSFEQLERAIEKLLFAYALAVGTSVLNDGRFQEVLYRVVKFEERMQENNLFAECVIEGDTDGKRRAAIVEEYLRSMDEQHKSPME